MKYVFYYLNYFTDFQKCLFLIRNSELIMQNNLELKQSLHEYHESSFFIFDRINWSTKILKTNIYYRLHIRYLL